MTKPLTIQLSDLADECDELGIAKITRARKHAQYCSGIEIGCVREWNENQSCLQAITEELRFNLNRVDFLERWGFQRLNSTTRQPVIHSLAIPVEIAIRVLRVEHKKSQQKIQDLRTAIKAMLLYSLRDIAEDFASESVRKPFEQPITLMRFWTQNSHCPHDSDFGFQCSGLATCKPAGSFQELLHDGLDLRHIRTHCENQPSAATHWISFSDDASWILKKVNRLANPTTQVAIISVRKLDRLKIWWQRSDLLVQQMGGKCWSELYHPDGIQYAWHSHYLVYGWIPAECIIATFDLASFRRECEQRNIKEGLYALSSKCFYNWRGIRRFWTCLTAKNASEFC